MSGGRELQRRGAERLKALDPMVDRRAEGGGRSERPGGDTDAQEGREVWGGEVMDGLIWLIRCLMGSQELVQNGGDVTDGRRFGADPGSSVLDQLEFMEELVGKTK